MYLASILKYLTRKLVLGACWGCRPAAWRPGRPESLPTVKSPAVSPTRKLVLGACWACRPAAWRPGGCELVDC